MIGAATDPNRLESAMSRDEDCETLDEDAPGDSDDAGRREPDLKELYALLTRRVPRRQASGSKSSIRSLIRSIVSKTKVRKSTIDVMLLIEALYRRQASVAFEFYEPDASPGASPGVSPESQPEASSAADVAERLAYLPYVLRIQAVQAVARLSARPELLCIGGRADTPAQIAVLATTECLLVELLYEAVRMQEFVRMPVLRPGHVVLAACRGGLAKLLDEPWLRSDLVSILHEDCTSKSIALKYNNLAAKCRNSADLSAACCFEPVAGAGE